VRHREASRRGGMKGIAPPPSVAPITITEITPASLETLVGLRRLLACTLSQLAQLPIDTRTATALGQIATAQRTLIEGSDIETRLAALEASQATGPQLVQRG